MRIVLLANFYGPSSGGIRTTMHALASGYRTAGHESILVVPAADDGDEQTPYGRRITLRGPRLPGSGYRLLTDVDRVCALLDRLAPDRVEVSDRLTLRDLGWWGRAAGVPTVGWAHERVDGVLRAFGGRRLPAAGVIADLHNRGTVRRFDRIVCTTRFAAEEFQRIRAGNVVQVPLGVDLQRFAPDRADPAVRARWAPGGPLLVLCGRLSREKRPELAVEALRQLRRRGVPAQLVVAGHGQLERALRRRAAGLPVHFLGFVGSRGAVARLLASADVVLAPGPIETFGLAALEALACGTPVVASATSALAEVVDDSCGALAAPEAVAFAAAVDAVLARPAAGWVDGARARAEQFPWSRTVAAMLDVHAAAGAS